VPLVGRHGDAHQPLDAVTSAMVMHTNHWMLWPQPWWCTPTTGCCDLSHSVVVPEHCAVQPQLHAGNWHHAASSLCLCWS